MVGQGGAMFGKVGYGKEDLVRQGEAVHGEVRLS